MNRAERNRIIIDNDGRSHTVTEKLYKEIDDAIRQGTVNSYLIHPNRAVRFLAELKIRLHKGVAG